MQVHMMYAPIYCELGTPDLNILNYQMQKTFSIVYFQFKSVLHTHSTELVVMDSKIVVFVCMFVAMLMFQCACADPLRDQLPDTSGLFFGKRSSHPNMNNLLFGRRSYPVEDFEDARKICRAVLATCARWGLEEN